MARYKTIDTSPRFIAVDLQRQLLPGSFEQALNYLVDHELDLARFDARHKNDLTGASAYAVETVLPGAQHREAGASRACAVGEKGAGRPCILRMRAAFSESRRWRHGATAIQSMK